MNHPTKTGRRQVRRGDNLRFIASYLFAHPFSKPSEVRKALVRYNRVPLAHHSHYSEYVYNNCSRKPPYEHLWARATDNMFLSGAPDYKFSRGRIQLQLTLRGMGHVDMALVERLRKCEDYASL